MIALACDFAGLPLKKDIMTFLDKENIAYKDFGVDSQEPCDYPHYAYRACQAVLDGACHCAILFCGSGIGMSIVANKMNGIRCVCCSEPYSAKMSKLHNDTNALALGARVVASGLARDIVEQWLKTDFEGGIHRKRLDLINKLEKTGEL